MKRRRSHKPYTLFGGLFLGTGLAGVLFLGWGELRLAFLLLVYCVLIIGFRLDEITRQLETIDKRLADALPPRQAPPTGDDDGPHPAQPGTEPQSDREAAP